MRKEFHERFFLDDLSGIRFGDTGAGSAVELALGDASTEWVPHQGVYGGHGWRNTITDEVVYQKDRPSVSRRESAPAQTAAGDEDLIVEGAEEIASFYCALWNAQLAGGVDPDEDSIHDAMAELEHSGITLEHDEDGIWEVVPEHEEAGADLSLFTLAGDDGNPWQQQKAPGGTSQNRWFNTVTQKVRYSKTRPGTGRAKKTPGTPAAPKPRTYQPVTHEDVKARLEPHARELTAREKGSAKAAWGMLQRHHGEHALSRVHELTDQAEAALEKLSDKSPRAQELRRQLAKWQHIVGGGPKPAPEEPIPAGAGDLTPRMVTAREDQTHPADTSVIPGHLHKFLVSPDGSDHQLQGAAKAMSALDSAGGFLLGDGPGAGKTRQALAVASTYAARGKKVLYVAPAGIIKPDWKAGTLSGSVGKDAATMGVGLKLNRGVPIGAGEIHVTTYEQLGKIKDHIDKDTIVIFDESHGLKNAESSRAQHGKEIAALAGGVLYGTATPADKPLDVAYLFRTQLFGDEPWSRAKKRFSVALHGAAKVDQAVSEMFGKLTDAGLMVKREISLDGVEAHFDHVTLSEADQMVLHHAGADAKNRALQLMAQRYAQEKLKIPHAVKAIQKELAEGRQVVIFVAGVSDKEDVDEETGEVLGKTRGTAGMLQSALVKAGIAPELIGQLHGGEGGGGKEVVEGFQTGAHKIIITTAASGGTGHNMDDTRGDRPRTQIILTAPFSAIDNAQIWGRTHRLTTKSASRMRYLFADTDVDRWNADLIRSKVASLGAIVGGEVQRQNIPEFPAKSGTLEAEDGSSTQAVEMSHAAAETRGEAGRGRTGTDSGGASSAGDPGTEGGGTAGGGRSKQTTGVVSQGLQQPVTLSTDLEGPSDWQDLAKFYAGFLGALDAAGDPPDDDLLASIDDELDGSGWYVDKDEATGHWTAKHESEVEGLTLAAERAPAGGVVIAGKRYKGGQFIPAKVVAEATPDERAKIEGQKAGETEKVGKQQEARKKRGSVDVPGLQARLAWHTATPLTALEKRSAGASFRMFKRHHGEMALHRLDELARRAEQALEGIGDDHPNARGLRSYFGRVLAKMASMVEMAQGVGITGRVVPVAEEMPAVAPVEAIEEAELVEEKRKEPHEMTRREYMATGGVSLPEDHPLMAEADQLRRDLARATGDLMEAAGAYRKLKMDTATKRTDIGAAMEFSPHTIETALKSTKVPRPIKDAYRAAKSKHAAASAAIDDATDHRAAVEQAMKAGKPVPPEILAEYPDLRQAAPTPEDAIEVAEVVPEPISPSLRAAHESRVWSLMDELEPDAHEGASVDLTHLRQRAGLSKTDFDHAVLGMAAAGKIDLHRHVEPSMLAPGEEDDLVTDGEGNYFLAAARRPEYHGRPEEAEVVEPEMVGMPAPTPAPKAKEPWEMTTSELVGHLHESPEFARRFDAKYPGGAFLAHSSYIKDAVKAGKPVPFAVRKEAGVLEPHEMTLQEAMQEYRQVYQHRAVTPDQIAEVKKRHRATVEAALVAGKEIPADVLADYPDLKPSATAPTPATPHLSSLPLPDFAREVQQIADATSTGGFGDNKVFISHVLREAQKRHPGLTEAEFKRRLAEAQHAGLLALSRADLVQVMNADDVSESDMLHPSGTGQFHFIQSNHSNREQTKRKPVVPASAPAAPAVAGDPAELAARYKQSSGWEKSGADRLSDLAMMQKSGRVNTGAVVDYLNGYGRSRHLLHPLGATVDKVGRELLANLDDRGAKEVLKLYESDLRDKEQRDQLPPAVRDFLASKLPGEYLFTSDGGDTTVGQALGAGAVAAPQPGAGPAAVGEGGTAGAAKPQDASHPMFGVRAGSKMEKAIQEAMAQGKLGYLADRGVWGIGPFTGKTAREAMEGVQQAEREPAERLARIRKAAHDAYNRGGTVPFSLRDLIEAGISIDRIRKIIRREEDR